MAEQEQSVQITKAELTAALAQWDVDAKANGWESRTDPERFADGADYLIHTIRLARGEGYPKKKDD